MSLTTALANSTPGVMDTEDTGDAFKENLKRLEELQYKLFVDGRFGLLVVLQAMDGGGKDSTIRHVFTAFNPQGSSVCAFKVPTAEEAKHDFLWRVHKRAPGRGDVVIFNRSHYEDVLVARVDKLVPRSTWSARYAQINSFEATLAAQGICVVKFMLHISKKEQLKRFASRLSEPRKLWKFDPGDLAKRRKWNAYRAAFEEALVKCSTEWGPWYVIPANRKWYRDFAVSQIVRETLEELPLRWPAPGFDPAKIKLQ